jgi:hypothetical protein
VFLCYCKTKPKSSLKSYLAVYKKAIFRDSKNKPKNTGGGKQENVFLTISG